MNKFDVLIVGNGILGLSTAYSLITKDSSLSIGIIGPRNREGSATLAAGAMLNAFGEITSATLKTKANKAKFEISLNALRLWPSWLEGVNSYLAANEKIHISPETFIILNSKSGKLDTENFEAILSALIQYNEKYEEINPDAIPGLDPIEDCRPLRALRLPNEGSITASLLLEAFEKILTTNFKVTLIDGLAQKVGIQKNTVESITLENHEQLFSKQIILANGACCQKLIDQIPPLADKIPRLLSGVGSSLILEQNSEQPIQHVIRTPNRSGACGLHVLPHEGNKLYVGATNNVFFNPEIQGTAGLSHFLLECLIEQINEEFYKSRVFSWGTGNRPVTIDGFPLVGKTSIKGLFLLTGTYREGFHQSPILANFIASQVLEINQILSHNMFQPERALIPTLTKEEAIIETSKHFICGGYERGMKLPKIGWDKLIREMFHKRLEELYEKLDTEFGLSPDITLMFEFDPNPAERIRFFKEYFKRQQGISFAA